ncbi:hypothetical protein [Agrococcus sp. Marseille-P2731]|uniref:hypothetical protein n=1 Tax=Agrococcus sp. Marseille-P2731 TaxID=1841862 RepID=UPI0011609BBA|nr:hypothetical protein [Agrococcus sp. Marseille-P2731]
MTAPAPLPAPFGGQPFRVCAALRAGVTAGRLRSGDLQAPFRGVRAPARVAGPTDGSAQRTSMGDPSLLPVAEQRATADERLRATAAAYALLMPAHHVFGGVTAARLWGLPLPAALEQEEALVIARPNGSTRGRARGTRHVAFDAARLRVTELEGLRLLTPLATTLMLARDLEHERLVHVVDALLTPSTRYPGLRLPRRPQVTREALRRMLGDAKSLRGAGALRAALADARVGVDSRFESIARRTIVLAGLPEPAVHPLVVIDGMRLRPDLGYPELKIAIEYEGEGHLSPKQWAIDIDRYERLEAAGWIVVRITKAHLARAGASCVRRVRAAIARRS